MTRPRQVDVLAGQAKLAGEAINTIKVTETTYYRWRRGPLGGAAPSGHAAQCESEREWEWIKARPWAPRTASGQSAKNGSLRAMSASRPSLAAGGPSGMC